LFADPDNHYKIAATGRAPKAEHLKRCSNETVPFLDITKDIQSLTTFRRRPAEFLKQLKKSRRPVVLTVKGKAAAIVQDAEAYQRLLDIAARADVLEGIRQGLEDMKDDKVRPAAEFFEEFEAKHGVRR
jgi:prevent-host-death family protein